MCTAATYQTNYFYFGRTLDYEFSYVDEVTITPRNYPFNFSMAGNINRHYAIMGIAYVVDGYPLYYGSGVAGTLCQEHVHPPHRGGAGEI